MFATGVNTEERGAVRVPTLSPQRIGRCIPTSAESAGAVPDCDLLREQLSLQCLSSGLDERLNHCLVPISPRASSVIVLDHIFWTYRGLVGILAR